MNTLFLTLFCPEKGFRLLKTAKFSGLSLAVILLLMLVNLFLIIPVSEKILQITMSSLSVPQNQTDITLELVNKLKYLQAICTVILNAVMFLIYAFLLYLFVRISRSKLEYIKAFQLIVCSYFIVVLGDLVNTMLVYIRGLDTIKNMYDISLTGVNFFTSVEKVGAIWYTFLSQITLFQLGFITLLSIGLRIFTGMKQGKAILISILMWLVIASIPVFSVYLSEATLTKSGLM